MRAVAIIIEVLILIGMLYCIFLSIRLTILDIGFHSKYDRFINWTLGMVGVAISAFFIAHLILFYPKILP